MARSLKTRGRDELFTLRARVLRQFSLGRIDRGDKDYLIDLIDRVDARIVQMRETNEEGEEEG